MTWTKRPIDNSINKTYAMALTKYKIGDLIEPSEERNWDCSLGIGDVRGISNTKEIMPTKADVDNEVIKKFYIVRPCQFIYNPRTTRMGDKVGLAYNNTDKPLLFSFNNFAFKIKESAKDLILPEYLYMFYNRSEFDRYAIVHSWGSATELFTFEAMCDMNITLPSLSTQRRYVDVYLSMQNNLQQYQSRLSDLKLTCDAYIENLRRTLPSTPIGAYIEEVNVRNTDNAYTLDDIKGISTEKSFIETKANMDGVSLDSYKVVKPSEFAFVPDTSRRGDKIAAAYNDMEKGVLISSIYTTFKVNRPDVLIADYLFMFLNRPEFDRYARYHSWGSAREVFTMEDMCNVSIPIPSLSIQREIVDIYACYLERQRIASELKSTLSRLCPLLIRGSLLVENNS